MGNPFIFKCLYDLIGFTLLIFDGITVGKLGNNNTRTTMIISRVVK